MLRLDISHVLCYKKIHNHTLLDLIFMHKFVNAIASLKARVLHWVSFNTGENDGLLTFSHKGARKLTCTVLSGKSILRDSHIDSGHKVCH